MGPFSYDKFVSGKNYIGRKRECRALANLLSSGENVVLYSPPKEGKMSAIQNTLFNMKMSGEVFSVCTVNFFNVRTIESFLLKFGGAVLRSMATTADEYEAIIESHLSGTHFVFDRDRYQDYDEVVSLNWDADANDIYFMLRLPGRIAAARGEKLYMVIDDFQTLADLEDSDKVMRAFKEVLGERRLDGLGCTYIITGSRHNAMRAIFAKSTMFRGTIENFTVPSAEDGEIAEYITKGLLLTGKVIEKDAALGVARMFSCNMWYINQFVSICESMTKGYITNALLMDALAMLLSVHEPRFKTAMSNLTWHQVSFLQAVIDGVTRFTSADVIRKYRLNSSANVVRVKEALMKKELISFNEQDEPVILDVLFKYWLEKFYFA